MSCLLFYCDIKDVPFNVEQDYKMYFKIKLNFL